MFISLIKFHSNCNGITFHSYLFKKVSVTSYQPCDVTCYSYILLGNVTSCQWFVTSNQLLPKTDTLLPAFLCGDDATWSMGMPTKGGSEYRNLFRHPFQRKPVHPVFQWWHQTRKWGVVAILELFSTRITHVIDSRDDSHPCIQSFVQDITFLILK